MQLEMQSEILLESGTNEMEIMQFMIADQTYGINVAKVKEIKMICPVQPMQKAQANIEGIFKSREKIVTVINLANYLTLPESENPERDIFIVTNFNNTEFAFHVHQIVGIKKISWKQIKKPDKIIYGGKDGVATGIAEVEGGILVTILDFEKIVSEISPDLGIQYSDLEKLGKREHSDKPILLAEDSMLLSKMVAESLRRAGYDNLIKTNNGQEAWDFLSEVKNANDPLRDHVACVVTDIEMPLMDGHHLTKLIKDDPVLKDLPVILFSSLINEEMRRKGEQVGANAQITKPEIARLVTLVDELIL